VVRFARALVAIVVVAATAAMVAAIAMVAMVTTVAMVAVVAMLALVVLVALIVLILVLFAPEVLRGMRRAALEIGTRAGLTQAWIGYGWGIRSGQGQEQPSHHPDDHWFDFHDDLPNRRWVP